MISAVLDTNVLASGVLGMLRPTSTPGELIRLWREQRFIWVVSEHIHTELANTFADAYFRRRLSDGVPPPSCVAKYMVPPPTIVVGG